MAHGMWVGADTSGTPNIARKVSNMWVGADTTTPSLPIPTSTSALFHFDGNYDDATSRNTPSIYGSANYVDGKVSNKAIHFNGESCVQIPYNSNIVFGSGSFTIAGWFKFTQSDTTHYAGLFSHQRYYNSTYGFSGITVFRNPTTGCIGVRFYTSYSTVSKIDSSYSPQINTWIHVALVRNDSTLTLYVDGTSVGSVDVGTSSAYQPSNATFKIGSRTTETSNEDTPYNFFTGDVDDFIIAKEALWTSNFTPPTVAYGTQGGETIPNIARKVTKGWVGADGIARLFYGNNHPFTIVETHNINAQQQTGWNVSVGNPIFMSASGKNYNNQYGEPNAGINIYSTDGDFSGVNVTVSANITRSGGAMSTTGLKIFFIPSWDGYAISNGSESSSTVTNKQYTAPSGTTGIQLVVGLGYPSTATTCSATITSLKIGNYELVQ